MLGVRTSGKNFVLDPVLNVNLNNLKFTYKILEKCCIIVYRATNESKVVINGNEVPFTRENNSYRQGGYVIESKYLSENNNIIEVHY